MSFSKTLQTGKDKEKLNSHENKANGVWVRYHLVFVQKPLTIRLNVAQESNWACFQSIERWTVSLKAQKVANMADSAVYRALKLYVNNYGFLFPFLYISGFFFWIYLSLIWFLFFSHIAQDKFYIEPRDQQSVGDQILEIDRVTQDLSLAGMWGKIYKTIAFGCMCYAEKVFPFVWYPTFLFSMKIQRKIHLSPKSIL